MKMLQFFFCRFGIWLLWDRSTPVSFACVSLGFVYNIIRIFEGVSMHV